MTADKNDAPMPRCTTSLVKLARLLAPFTPFVTEAMYQNLVRCARSEAHESIHHTRWPVDDQRSLDETMLDQMALARR